MPFTKLSSNAFRETTPLPFLRLLLQYSANSVLTLYKWQCSLVLTFLSFAFMDVVILVSS